MELSELPFDPDEERQDVARFVSTYLRTDGVFVLRMIVIHGGLIFGTDVILQLWKEFYNIETEILLQQTPKFNNDNSAKANRRWQLALTENNMTKIRKSSMEDTQKLMLDLPDSAAASTGHQQQRRGSKQDMHIEMAPRRRVMKELDAEGNVIDDGKDFTTISPTHNKRSTTTTGV